MISSGKIQTLRAEGRAGLGDQYKVVDDGIRGVALLSVGDVAGSGTTIIDAEALTDIAYAIRNGGNVVYASAEGSLTDTGNVVGELRNPKIVGPTLRADVVLFDDSDTRQARERLLRFAGRKPGELTAVCHTSYALARTGKQRREWRAVIGDFLGASFALVTTTRKTQGATTVANSPATSKPSRKNGASNMSVKPKRKARRFREPLKNEDGEPLGTCTFADGSTEEDCTERRCQANHGESWVSNSKLPERGKETGVCVLPDGSERETTFDKCNRLGGKWQHPERDDAESADTEGDSKEALSTSTPGLLYEGTGPSIRATPATLGEALQRGLVSAWRTYAGRRPSEKQLRNFKRDQRIRELEDAGDDLPGVCVLPSGDTADTSREECVARGGEWSPAHDVEDAGGLPVGQLAKLYQETPSLRRQWGTIGRFTDAINTSARDAAHRILRRDQHVKARR